MGHHSPKLCAGRCRTLGGLAGTRAPATYLYSLACAARASRMGGAGAHATVLCQVGQCGYQLGASLLDALEHIDDYRRRRRPAYPGADQEWRTVMGEEPLPARFFLYILYLVSQTNHYFEIVH